MSDAESAPRATGIHTHGAYTKYVRMHDHAYPDHPHSHYMRAICWRPECDGFPTHDIHSAPADALVRPAEDEPEA